MCDRPHTPLRHIPATVQRLLIRRSHIALLAIVALAFPAAALAVTTGGSARVGLAEAEVVPVASDQVRTNPLQRSSANFRDLVAGVAEEIRSKEAERVKREQRQEEEDFEDLHGGVSIETL